MTNDAKQTPHLHWHVYTVMYISCKHKPQLYATEGHLSLHAH